MSIKKMIEDKIRDLRSQIAVWDNLKASSEEKGKVLAALVGNDPHFWAEVAKRATVKPVSTKTPNKAQIKREVAKMEMVATPASKPTTIVPAAPAPAPKPAPAMPAPVTTVAPRTLQEPKLFDMANGLKTWLGFLTGIIRGSNIPWKTAQTLTTKLFSGGVKLTQEQWGLFFSAMKIADQKGDHLINNDAKPGKIFALAPAGMVDNLLFGQDGILPSLTGEIADCGEDLPAWLSAKASVILDAVEVVDARNGIGEQEEKRVEDLLDAIDRANGPDWLVAKGKVIWSGPQAPAGSTSRMLAGIGEVATQLERIN